MARRYADIKSSLNQILQHRLAMDPVDGYNPDNDVDYLALLDTFVSKVMHWSYTPSEFERLLVKEHLQSINYNADEAYNELYKIQEGLSSQLQISTGSLPKIMTIKNPAEYRTFSLLEKLNMSIDYALVLYCKEALPIWAYPHMKRHQDFIVPMLGYAISEHYRISPEILTQLVLKVADAKTKTIDPEQLKSQILVHISKKGK